MFAEEILNGKLHFCAVLDLNRYCYDHEITHHMRCAIRLVLYLEEACFGVSKYVVFI